MHALQPVKRVIVVLLRPHGGRGERITSWNVDLLPLQVPVIVGHLGGTVVAATHAQAGAVEIYDCPAVPPGVVAGVVSAHANLSQLATAVVEEFVVEGSVGTKLLFGHRAKRRIKDFGSIVSCHPIAEIAGEREVLRISVAQTASHIVVVRDCAWASVETCCLKCSPFASSKVAGRTVSRRLIGAQNLFSPFKFR